MKKKYILFSICTVAVAAAISLLGAMLFPDRAAALILTVRTGDYEKTIRADDVSLAYEAIFPKGKRFVNTLDSICHILISTEEWKALPDYEFYYD